MFNMTSRKSKIIGVNIALGNLNHDALFWFQGDFFTGNVDGLMCIVILDVCSGRCYFCLASSVAWWKQRFHVNGGIICAKVCSYNIHLKVSLFIVRSKSKYDCEKFYKSNFIRKWFWCNFFFVHFWPAPNMRSRMKRRALCFNYKLFWYTETPNLSNMFCSSCHNKVKLLRKDCC